MGIAYNTSIVRSGLVVHLDAANVKSYSGTGTVWKDISGNGYNHNMINGAMLDNSGNGCIYFDAVNDKVERYPLPAYTVSTSTVTVSAWVKVDVFGNWTNFINNHWVNNGWLMYSSSTHWYFGVGKASSQYNAGFAHNNFTGWTNLTGTYDSSNVNLYVNGILKTSVPLVGNTLDIFTIDIGGGTRPGPYRINNVLMYNRALTAQEIKSNFSAIRGRYGI
jgi:hypothetical protein